jgi:hypothetical protein
MRISTLLLAAAAGFLAGAFSSRLTPVYAQGSGVEVLQSKSFVLLDGAGHRRGEWKMDSSGQPVLRLFDAQGHIIWQTGKAGPQLLHEP